MSKVYLFTTGRYSDYCVEAVFTTKEKAEQASLLYRGGDQANDIEEYELDPQLEDVSSYEIGNLYQTTIYYSSGDTLGERTLTNILRHPSRCEIIDHDWMITVRSPISEEHSQKVAIEKRQEFLRKEKPA